MSGADKRFLYSLPVLLVDVDGVISLFGFDPLTPPPGRWLNVEGVLHLISATAGEALRNLARDFELVWCTGWEEKAPAYLPAALGLPGATIHLSFERNPGRGNTHWKLAAIEAYAGPARPVAWIDDALDGRCRAWAEDRQGPTRLIETDPALGITAEHVAALRAWAQSIVSKRTPSAR